MLARLRGSGPDDVLFDPTGQKLVVPLVNTSTIGSLVLSGLKHCLRRRPVPPLASGHGRPVGTVYRLSNGQLLYVRDNHPR
jgi:hypothetical protein